MIYEPIFNNYVPVTIEEFNRSIMGLGYVDRQHAKTLFYSLVDSGAIYIETDDIYVAAYGGSPVVIRDDLKLDIKDQVELFNLFGLRIVSQTQIESYSPGQVWTIRITYYPGYAPAQKPEHYIEGILKSIREYTGEILSHFYEFNSPAITRVTDDYGYLYIDVVPEFSMDELLKSQTIKGDLLTTLDIASEAFTTVLGVHLSKKAETSAGYVGYPDPIVAGQDPIKTLTTSLMVVGLSLLAIAVLGYLK